MAKYHINPATGSRGRIARAKRYNSRRTDREARWLHPQDR